MTDDEVPAKKEAAIRWCQQASEHALNHDGRPWTYVLIPHDSIAENMTLDCMARQYLRDSSSNAPTEIAELKKGSGARR
jgi:type III restriction enzyme